MTTTIGTDAHILPTAANVRLLFTDQKVCIQGATVTDDVFATCVGATVSQHAGSILIQFAEMPAIDVHITELTTDSIVGTSPNGDPVSILLVQEFNQKV